MNTPDDRSYSQTHEWVLVKDDQATIGITDHAQSLLGDVTFVDLPPVGTHVTAGSEAGSIESVKAASEIYSPVTGTVIKVNTALEQAPEKINTDPYGEGWLFTVAQEGMTDALLNAAAYDAFCTSDKH